MQPRQSRETERRYGPRNVYCMAAGFSRVRYPLYPPRRDSRQWARSPHKIADQRDADLARGHRLFQGVVGLLADVLPCCAQLAGRSRCGFGGGRFPARRWTGPAAKPRPADRAPPAGSASRRRRRVGHGPRPPPKARRAGPKAGRPASATSGSLHCTWPAHRQPGIDRQQDHARTALRVAGQVGHVGDADVGRPVQLRLNVVLLDDDMTLCRFLCFRSVSLGSGSGCTFPSCASRSCRTACRPTRRRPGCACRRQELCNNGWQVTHAVEFYRSTRGGGAGRLGTAGRVLAGSKTSRAVAPCGRSAKRLPPAGTSWEVSAARSRCRIAQGWCAAIMAAGDKPPAARGLQGDLLLAAGDDRPGVFVVGEERRARSVPSSAPRRNRPAAVRSTYCRRRPREWRRAGRPESPPAALLCRVKGWSCGPWAYLTRWPDRGSRSIRPGGGPRGIGVAGLAPLREPLVAPAEEKGEQHPGNHHDQGNGRQLAEEWVRK